METSVWQVSPDSMDQAVIDAAAAMIRRGGLVAFPTETVYGLGADVFQPKAVASIFAAKGRPADNPLIAHIAAPEQVYDLAREVPDTAKCLMEHFWGGPLTMILPKKHTIPDEVTAGLDTVGIRMPSHSVANALIRAAGTPIAAPSANRSGSPSPTTAEHCIADLLGRVDAILDGGTAMIGVESTVVDLSVPVPTILRPGAISAEDMADVLGCPVRVGGLEAHAPKCPGMKYTHYSPSATVICFENAALVQPFVQAHQDEVVCVMALSDAASSVSAPLVYDAGRDSTDYAARLFYLLRKADEDGASIVLAQLPSAQGIGLAVRNRLQKSSGGNMLESRE